MAGNHIYQPVEIWGGVECTVNRVGDKYYDQLLCNGHHHRLTDLDLFASLGIRTLRYPVLWERIAPKSLNHPDWQWADDRLNHLKKLGINPIAGLVHHGSGPRYTDLLDPAFATGLEKYAGMVAERYPWISYYTPVNEPLTTARFSGLYGLWYPHLCDPLQTARMLLHQCRGTVLAMQAIRKVNPEAKLIQTEDLGQTHSTPLLAYQAEFENSRRWLTYDLLCGLITKHHPMHQYLRWLGITEKELRYFSDNPCPPDVIGINHYLTSERFLDEKLERYPPHLHGGNGKHQYVDTEAIRIPEVEVAGPYKLLQQTWQRYQLPIAVTEVHLGCTREDQLRWLNGVWQAASQLSAEGAAIRAITPWAMLGSFDWDSLLTNWRGHYEPGVFDIRSLHPRPTALAGIIKQLAKNQQPDHPVLDGSGWWQRNDRWIGHCATPVLTEIQEDVILPASGKPILITGASGTLGKAFARICTQRGIAFRLLSRQEMDITNPEQVKEVVEKMHPWAIINTAGYVRVAQAEQEPERCFMENTDGPLNLAVVCKEHRIPLLTFSTDLVFDGFSKKTYIESDEVNPQNVYGASKAAAEKKVLALLPDALIIRTSAFFGPWDEYNFATLFLRSLQAGEPVGAVAHMEVSPTYVPDLVHASLDLLIDGEKGIWHLSNTGAVTWAGFGKMIALQAGFDPVMVEGWYQSQAEEASGKKIISNVLSSERAAIMPSLDSAVARYVQDCEMLCLPPITAEKILP